MRLKVDGRCSVGRVGITVGQPETLIEMLARVGDVIRQVVLDESRRDHTLRPGGAKRVNQEEERRQSEQQGNLHRDGRLGLHPLR